MHILHFFYPNVGLIIDKHYLYALRNMPNFGKPCKAVAGINDIDQLGPEPFLLSVFIG